jgi:hypothetical protein
MAINTAIQRAYEIKLYRNWDKVYFAIDIHGTILKPEYNGMAQEFYDDAIDTLKYMRTLPEIVIILWSSCKAEDYQNYIDLFNSHGIRVDYFNENPECADTKVGAFDKKFYFSVLLDDKAGFDPYKDWTAVRIALSNEQYKMGTHR